MRRERLELERRDASPLRADGERMLRDWAMREFARRDDSAWSGAGEAPSGAAKSGELDVQLASASAPPSAGIDTGSSERGRAPPWALPPARRRARRSA